MLDIGSRARDPVLNAGTFRPSHFTQPKPLPAPPHRVQCPCPPQPELTLLRGSLSSLLLSMAVSYPVIAAQTHWEPWSGMVFQLFWDSDLRNQILPPNGAWLRTPAMWWVLHQIPSGCCLLCWWSRLWSCWPWAFTLYCGGRFVSIVVHFFNFSVTSNFPVDSFPVPSNLLLIYPHQVVIIQVWILDPREAGLACWSLFYHFFSIPPFCPFPPSF